MAVVIRITRFARFDEGEQAIGKEKEQGKSHPLAGKKKPLRFGRFLRPGGDRKQTSSPKKKLPAGTDRLYHKEVSIAVVACADLNDAGAQETVDQILRDGGQAFPLQRRAAHPTSRPAIRTRPAAP